MLFSSKNEWNVDTRYDVDEPQKPYAKWKKPNAHARARTHTHTTLIIQFYLYEMSKIGISIETESRWNGCLGLGRAALGRRYILRVMEML